MSFITAAATGSEPAGGAEISQIVIATAGAMLVTAALLFLCLGHRRGSNTVLARLGAFAERVSGLPAWAALPTGLATGSLLTALLGMYWDIALHIDDGRDAGPLANPAHYFILAGLFGIFAAGVLAVSMPRDERPGKAALKLGPNWYAPVGGVLTAAAGGFALLGFPLDDLWHRLFGQDVTLWGPTHLMLIGGAGMCLVGMAVLMAEGMQVRRERAAAGDPIPEVELPGSLTQERVTSLRRVGLMGGFLIGLSTFQAEFDFGVPQYRFAFEPILIALAASIALVAARIWIGRGGALGAVAFFLVIRGGLAVLVGPVLGETTPHLPLYVVEALCVEAAALLLIRRPMMLGAVGGLLIGTIGFASEWGWSQFAMPFPWTVELVPEALLGAIAIGVMGGLTGALFALGLRGELPSPAIARAVPAAAIVSFAIIAAALLQVDEGGGRVFVAPGADGNATVRVEPASLTDDAGWVTVTAWQGGSLHLDHLEPTGRPGEFRTTKPLPVNSSYKTLVRVHKGTALFGAPVYLPADQALGAPEIPVPVAGQPRGLVHDQLILQRERKEDIPGWLWSTGVGTVLVIWLGFLVALSWGVGRVARRGGTSPDEPRPQARVTSAPPARPATAA